AERSFAPKPMMIAQLHRLATASRIMTACTSTLACVTRPIILIESFCITGSVPLPDQWLERRHPFARLAPGPAGRGDERRLHFRFGHYGLLTHDSLMNIHGRRAQTQQMADHDQFVAEAGRRAIFNGERSDRIGPL